MLGIKEAVNNLLAQVENVDSAIMVKTPLGEISLKGLMWQVIDAASGIYLHSHFTLDERRELLKAFDAHGESFPIADELKNNSEFAPKGKLADVVGREIEISDYLDTLFENFRKTGDFKSIISPTEMKAEASQAAPRKEIVIEGASTLSLDEMKSDLLGAIIAFNENEKIGASLSAKTEYAEELLNNYAELLQEVGQDEMRAILASDSFPPNAKNTIDFALKFLEENGDTRFAHIKTPDLAAAVIESHEAEGGVKQHLLPENVLEFLEQHRKLSEIYGSDYAEQLFDGETLSEYEKALDIAQSAEARSRIITNIDKAIRSSREAPIQTNNTDIKPSFS